MRYVQKYGGTSLESPRLVRAAAMRAADLVRQGHEAVIVVSAQGHTTDRLLEKARQLVPEPSARELDACLAAGEQISAALTAMAVEALGLEAISLTGAQAGIRTDGTYGNARILRVDTRHLEQVLAAGKIPVVAGFQGADPRGNITTLGRGGSDTTAVALAAWLKADVCQIFTDVEGVCDRDPRKFPHARRFERISYGDMLDLIDGGAQVLHRPCVELARDRGIRLEVRSAFSDIPGTLVGDLE